jgi:hypothetical protein
MHVSDVVSVLQAIGTTLHTLVADSNSSAAAGKIWTRLDGIARHFSLLFQTVLVDLCSGGESCLVSFGV